MFKGCGGIIGCYSILHQPGRWEKKRNAFYRHGMRRKAIELFMSVIRHRSCSQVRWANYLLRTKAVHQTWSSSLAYSIWNAWTFHTGCNTHYSEKCKSARLDARKMICTCKCCKILETLVNIDVWVETTGSAASRSKSERRTSLPLRKTWLHAKHHWSEVPKSTMVGFAEHKDFKHHTGPVRNAWL